MTPAQFKKWRKNLGLNQTKAAKRLGLKLRTVQYYEKGERKGKALTIPKTVVLACYAIANGVSDVDFSDPAGKVIMHDDSSRSPDTSKTEVSAKTGDSAKTGTSTKTRASTKK